MNKIIGIVVGVIFSLSILMVILSMSEDILYESVEKTLQEEFIAIKGTAASEYLELDYEYVTLNYISVNTVNIDLETDIIYAFSDEDTLVLITSISNVGDEIVVNYTYMYYGYDENYTDATINVVELLPTLIILIIISGIAVVIMKNKKAWLN